MKAYSLNSSQRRWTRTLLIIVFVVLFLLVAAAIVVRKEYIDNLHPASPSQRVVVFVIPKDSSVHDIAVSLKTKGLIRSDWAFEWYVRSKELNDKLQAGSYSLRPNQSVQDIVSVIANGKISTDLVTILPGQRLDQIQKALVNYGFNQADVTAAMQPELYKNHPALADKPAAASLEGYLYPESFQKTGSTTPSDIIKASLDEMQKRLTPEVRDGFVRQGLTVHQGVIVASIVEQEVSDLNAGDRAKVAQVFLSRLKIGMPLGSDVTAFYGAVHDNQKASLAYDSPYNTLIHKGLPPGPISNVSESSLKAVANPANTDYLYFVAGDDGITYFTHTLDEHHAATAAHCHKLCSAN